MKLYIGTLIERSEQFEPTIITLVSESSAGLANQIDDSLSLIEQGREVEIPRDFVDILIECENGNQDSEPLSIGEDSPFAEVEFLLSTTIKEI